MKKLLLVLLSCALSGPLAFGDVIRGPYLQQVTPNSVTVRWSTNTLELEVVGRVRYGTRVNALSRTVDEPIEFPYYDHEVTLSGLRPKTRYYYSVGITGEPAVAGDANQFFVTAPRSGRKVKNTRIWALGDCGTADSNAAAVRDAYVALAGSDHTDVLLLLGDNAYNTGTNLEYQAAIFDMYSDQLRTMPVWPVIGNHDGIGVYLDIFTLPTMGEAGGRESFTEQYYSFDHGNIHFIALDSDKSNRSTEGPMLTWLEEDLMLTDADWVIAFWHHPPYTKGSHDSDNPLDSAGRMRDMRENVLPLLDSYGVDLVLTGHSHSYERSMMLDSHYGMSDSLELFMVVDDGLDGVYTKSSRGSVPHSGAVYVVAGSSGKLGGGTLDHAAIVVAGSYLGSMVIDISKNVLSARFLRADGEVYDSFTIVKSGH